ncbi:MAG: TIGR00730 family Rossman fold protein [Paracoccaceae bacterium]|nr:TIGR00730 family Rossman fold protein [Paracoccaceae bacterium]
MKTSDYRASICVFCGSRPGDDPMFIRSAASVGAWIATSGFRLVYGAGDIGMMGAVADAARQSGGPTLGVIPIHLAKREIVGPCLPDCIVTEDMHERKKVMFMNSDAAVALPGGPGTLDELFEVLTWRQLGLHRKPVLLLNVNGFWDPLLTLINHQIRSGFADRSFRTFLEDFDTESGLFERLSGLGR